MKTKSALYRLLFVGLLLPSLFNCKKVAIKVIPTVNLSAVSNITSNSATSGGDVTSDGGSTVTAKGVCWGTNQSPTISDSKTNNGPSGGSFTSSIAGLNPGVTYTIRAYAINAIGTAYSSQSTFTTIAEAPEVTTTPISEMTTTTAKSGGTVISDGGSTILAKGVCWATTSTPTISNSKTTDGTGPGSFSSNISGLTPGITYYLRAYATNGITTSYGSEVSFTPGTVADIDGNVYHYIIIGTQSWMVENLKTTKYRNGDAIAKVAGIWTALVTGAYGWYKNDAATYKNPYGAMYNWYAVADSRNIAPVGWHVPSDAEWTTLTDFLGGTSVAGGNLKETGTAHWLIPNTGATNSSGFTALPGGTRFFDDGSFNGVGYNGYWWSSTTIGATFALGRNLGCSYATVNSYNLDKHFGFNVRCVRD